MCCGGYFIDRGLHGKHLGGRSPGGQCPLLPHTRHADGAGGKPDVGARSQRTLVRTRSHSLPRSPGRENELLRQQLAVLRRQVSRARPTDSEHGLLALFARLFPWRDREALHTPYRCPQANPHTERFVGSVHQECLDHMIPRNQEHLRKILAEFLGSYYHSARPHQGLDQQIPAEVHNPVERPKVGPIKTREVMNGLYHVYYRDAATGHSFANDDPDLPSSPHSRQGSLQRLGLRASANSQRDDHVERRVLAAQGLCQLEPAQPSSHPRSLGANTLRPGSGQRQASQLPASAWIQT